MIPRARGTGRDREEGSKVRKEKLKQAGVTYVCTYVLLIDKEKHRRLPDGGENVGVGKWQDSSTISSLRSKYGVNTE